MKHQIDFRVYYEDTDAGGIMYHASYIRFCERGRTEFLRHLGMSCSSLTEEKGIIFVIRHLEADYLQPARLDDLLEVCTVMKQIRNTSFVMEHVIAREGEKLFVMDVTVVCVGLNGKPTALPEKVKAAFQDYLC